MAFAQLTKFWHKLEVPRDFPVDLPPVSRFHMRELCDPGSLWWVVAYTEIAAETAGFILFEVFDNCRLWALRRDMIQRIRRLSLKTVIGNAGNARECLSLVEAIERSRFQEFPSEWSCRGMLPSLSPGHSESGPDYRFYNPFTCRFKSEGEVATFLRSMDLRVPSGNLVGWDFTEVGDDFVGANADLSRLRATLNGWGDASN